MRSMYLIGLETIDFFLANSLEMILHVASGLTHLLTMELPFFFMTFGFQQFDHQ